MIVICGPVLFAERVRGNFGKNFSNNFRSFTRLQPLMGLAEHAVGQSGWQPFPLGVCGMFIRPESWGLGRVKILVALNPFLLRLHVGEPLGHT